MTCPACKLENPPSALYCDCGHEFVEGSTLVTDGAPRGRTGLIPKKKDWLVALCAAVLGVALASIFQPYLYPHKGPGDMLYPYDFIVLGIAVALGFALAAYLILIIARYVGGKPKAAK
jgi:hypothetical protein